MTAMIQLSQAEKTGCN